MRTKPGDSEKLESRVQRNGFLNKQKNSGDKINDSMVIEWVGGGM